MFFGGKTGKPPARVEKSRHPFRVMVNKKWARKEYLNGLPYIRRPHSYIQEVDNEDEKEVKDYRHEVEG